MSDNIKRLLIIAIIIVVLSLSCIVLLNAGSKKKNYSYGDNKIIYKNVSYFDVGRTYYADFMTLMFSNVDEAYKLLDDNYKKELGNFHAFEQLVNEYIDNNYFDAEIVEFDMKELDDYKLFYLKDSNDRMFIFKEKGIMNYTVYLSESSVEL